MKSGLQLARAAIKREWPTLDIRLYRGNGSHAYYYFSGEVNIDSLYWYRIDAEDVASVVAHVRAAVTLAYAEQDEMDRIYRECERMHATR